MFLFSFKYIVKRVSTLKKFFIKIHIHKSTNIYWETENSDTLSSGLN